MNKKANMWVAIGIIIAGAIIIGSFIHLTWDFWSGLGETLYGGTGFFGIE